MTTTFIRHPGLSGPFGALMDEYARAAEDFCRVVDSFDLARFDAERPSNDPNTVSARAICLHVTGAAHRYAHYIRKARGVDFVERYEADAARLHSPRDVRSLLTEGIVLTEETVAPLLKATEQEIQALSFTVRWGPRYDPEMILEHAVCHLLRHRGSWNAGRAEGVESASYGRPEGLHYDSPTAYRADLQVRRVTTPRVVRTFRSAA